MMHETPSDDYSSFAATESPDEPGAKGLHLDTSVPAPERPLAESDVRSPRRRRILQPLVLFLATCFSTFFAGATNWMPHVYLADLQQARLAIETNWRDGLIYMMAVMGILVMHEMGHFVQTLRYRVPASLPIFLPVPLMAGTMGAVIVMDASKANRKQLFDIGLWGPWAGLVVAIPMIWFGIKTATPDPTAGDFPFGTPLIFKLITAYARPELTSGAVVKNPLFMAGWVGMLVTGLNMLPVSQLDGGHVIYGLFGARAKYIARAFIMAAITFIVVAEQYGWVVMLVLVLMLGVDHPPTRDDSVPLGPVRWTIGLLSLLIPVFCFTPVIFLGG
jgi:membrane-associated protease RseP (regulator of RpoE activity)